LLISTIRNDMNKYKYPRGSEWRKWDLHAPRTNSINTLIKRYQLILIVGLFSLIIILGMSNYSCMEKSVMQIKASSTLLLQIALRQQQLAGPTTERLSQIQSMGMNTTNMGIQRVYIYLKQPLTQTQINDLQSLGITIYLDSWIPPVGNHPTGFILADMPVDKLDALAAKDYVIKLDTAEIQAEPQSTIPEIKPQ